MAVREPESMKVFVNGEQRQCPDRTTIAALLRALELPEGRIAVERNREVVPRSRHSDTELAEGDRVELVRFVGGG
jgi:thiamine biosynthesis protein ThiS